MASRQWAVTPAFRATIHIGRMKSDGKPLFDDGISISASKDGISHENMGGTKSLTVQYKQNPQTNRHSHADSSR